MKKLITTIEIKTLEKQIIDKTNEINKYIIQLKIRNISMENIHDILKIHYELLETYYKRLRHETIKCFNRIIKHIKDI